MKFWRHMVWVAKEEYDYTLGTEFLEIPLLDDKKNAFDTLMSPDIWGKEILGLYGTSKLHPKDTYCRKTGRMVSENNSKIATFKVTGRTEDSKSFLIKLEGPATFNLYFFKDSGKLIIK